MDWKIVAVLVSSWTIAVVVGVRSVRTDRSVADKIAGIVLLTIPILGLLFYWFVYNDLPPQRSDLQNRGPRGSFTHNWIVSKPVAEEGLKRLAAKRKGRSDASQSNDEKP